MNTYHIYIHFPGDPETNISSREEGHRYIKNIQMLIDRADCEKGAILYFDNTHKNIFFEALKTIENDDLLGYIGALRYEEAVNYLIHEAMAVNWEERQIHIVNEDNIYYKEWICANRTDNDNFPAVLKEAAEREYRINDKQNEKCLLLNISTAYNAVNPICIIRGSHTECTLINISYVIDFIQLDNWFFANRINRSYNHNDNRHIEGHNDYRPGKSPLIGGIAGKPNAESLLNNAIGDQRKTTDLINYDMVNQCYIWYKYENNNPQNAYHGYHLVSPAGYQRDEEAERNIPERMKVLLEYRLNLTVI